MLTLGSSPSLHESRYRGTSICTTASVPGRWRASRGGPRQTPPIGIMEGHAPCAGCPGMSSSTRRITEGRRVYLIGCGDLGILSSQAGPFGSRGSVNPWRSLMPWERVEPDRACSARAEIG